MTINIDAVRRQVQGILLRFPSGTAEVRRPVFNAYGEETGTSEALFSGLTFWWSQPTRPKDVSVREKGATFEEDARKWACLIWEERFENVTRGDLFISGGKTYRVCNTETRMQVRVFWQVEEV